MASLPGRRAPLRAALPVVFLMALLTGCGDDSDAPGDGVGGSSETGEGEEEEGPSRLATPPVAAADQGPCTTEPTETDGLTDPGQVLCFGTPATLPVRNSSDTARGVMRLTITGIERADDSLIGQRIADGFPDYTEEAFDLWFIAAEAEVLEEDAPGSLDGVEPIGFFTGAYDAEGQVGESGVLFSPFEECEEAEFGDGEGGPVESCDWTLHAPGTEPYSVRYYNTDDYFRDQLVWAPE